MAIIATVLCLIGYLLNRGQDLPGYEAFDGSGSMDKKSDSDSDSGPTDMESFASEIHKIVADVDEFQRQMSTKVEHMNNHEAATDPVPKINRSIAGTTDTDSLNITDMDRIRNGNDSDDEGSMSQKKRTGEKKVSMMTPAEAQRETFKLINTVQQLEQTMQAMSPTIEQGKQIIGMLGSLAPGLGQHAA